MEQTIEEKLIELQQHFLNYDISYKKLRLCEIYDHTDNKIATLEQVANFITYLAFNKNDIKDNMYFEELFNKLLSTKNSDIQELFIKNIVNEANKAKNFNEHQWIISKIIDYTKPGLTIYITEDAVKKIKPTLFKLTFKDVHSTNAKEYILKNYADKINRFKKNNPKIRLLLPMLDRVKHLIKLHESNKIDDAHKLYTELNNSKEQIKQHFQDALRKLIIETYQNKVCAKEFISQATSLLILKVLKEDAEDKQQPYSFARKVIAKELELNPTRSEEVSELYKFVSRSGWGGTTKNAKQLSNIQRREDWEYEYNSAFKLISNFKDKNTKNFLNTKKITIEPFKTKKESKNNDEAEAAKTLFIIAGHKYIPREIINKNTFSWIRLINDHQRGIKKDKETFFQIKQNKKRINELFTSIDSKQNITALYYAVSKKSSNKVIEKLLKHGAKQNITSTNTLLTPLMFTVMMKKYRLDQFNLLIEKLPTDEKELESIFLTKDVYQQNIMLLAIKKLLLQDYNNNSAEKKMFLTLRDKINELGLYKIYTQTAKNKKFFAQFKDEKSNDLNDEGEELLSKLPVNSKKLNELSAINLIKDEFLIDEIIFPAINQAILKEENVETQLEKFKLIFSTFFKYSKPNEKQKEQLFARFLDQYAKSKDDEIKAAAIKRQQANKTKEQQSTKSIEEEEPQAPAKYQESKPIKALYRVFNIVRNKIIKNDSEFLLKLIKSQVPLYLLEENLDDFLRKNNSIKIITALHEAVFLGKFDWVIYILKYLDINDRDKEIATTNSYGETALHIAIYQVNYYFNLKEQNKNNESFNLAFGRAIFILNEIIAFTDRADKLPEVIKKETTLNYKKRFSSQTYNMFIKPLKNMTLYAKEKKNNKTYEKIETYTVVDIALDPKLREELQKKLAVGVVEDRNVGKAIKKIKYNPNLISSELAHTAIDKLPYLELKVFLNAVLKAGKVEQIDQLHNGKAIVNRLIECGQFSMAKKLIKAGINPTIQDKKGKDVIDAINKKGVEFDNLKNTTKETVEQNLPADQELSDEFKQKIQTANEKKYLKEIEQLKEEIKDFDDLILQQEEKYTDLKQQKDELAKKLETLEKKRKLDKEFEPTLQKHTQHGQRQELLKLKHTTNYNQEQQEKINKIITKNNAILQQQLNKKNDYLEYLANNPNRINPWIVLGLTAACILLPVAAVLAPTLAGVFPLAVGAAIGIIIASIIVLGAVSAFLANQYIKRRIDVINNKDAIDNSSPTQAKNLNPEEQLQVVPTFNPIKNFDKLPEDIKNLYNQGNFFGLDRSENDTPNDEGLFNIFNPKETTQNESTSLDEKNTSEIKVKKSGNSSPAN